MNQKAKAATGSTVYGFLNSKCFDFDNTSARQQTQLQTCPRCAREIIVPWLVAILYAPSQPVRVVGFCASCAGDVRYASPARQRAICDEIADRIGAGRRAA